MVRVIEAWWRNASMSADSVVPNDVEDQSDEITVGLGYS